MNSDLEGLMRWSATVGISININKTKAMILGSNYNLERLKLIDLPSIIVSNTRSNAVTLSPIKLDKYIGNI